MKHTVVETKKKSRLSNTQILIAYFFIFAFLGWIIETLFCFHTLGHFTNRGFLYGPICPIYGFGAIMLILFLSKYKHNSLKLFAYSAVIFSVFEYCVSFALEALFGIHWWDYTNEFMNVNGRAGIFYAFAWGIMAILFINHIYPFVQKLLNKVLDYTSYLFQVTVLRLVLVICFIDTITSCTGYFQLLF